MLPPGADRHKTWVVLGIVILARSCLALQQPRIAIVGAGVGGSFTAFFVRQLGPGPILDVFEKGEVGGRTQILSLNGEVIELGASIIHQENRYFREAADSLQLERRSPKSDRPSIYDGREFVFTSSYWSIINVLYMLLRYGWQYFIYMGEPASMLKRYKQIYDLQDSGKAFETPQELLQAVGLYDLTQHSFRAEVQAHLGSREHATLFVREFLGAVNRVQYNQNNSMSALAGMVGTLPVTDGRLFKIEGGNVKVPLELLDRANVRGHWPLAVTQIERNANGTYTLRTDTDADTTGIPVPEVWGPFDAVVIATPLEASHIEFLGLELPHIPPRKYQRTVSTVIRGRLDPAYFGVSAMPGGEYVMVTEDAATPFSVIAPISGVDGDGLRLYKTFSELPLDNNTLSNIFKNATVVTLRDWYAYPHFNPPEDFAPFQLAEGLFYGNAWENSASAMEMSAVAAKNSALLLQRHLASRKQPPADKRTADISACES